MRLTPPYQEAMAVEHFRKLVKPWRSVFTEDNWATTADHLHELLQKAMIAEGADPAWIAFAVAKPAPPPAQGERE